VVREDVSQLCRGEVGRSATNSREGQVRGREDRDVAGGVQGVSQVGGLESSGKYSQAGTNGCGGDVGRDREDTIDDVYYTTSEVDILYRSAYCSLSTIGFARYTHSLHDSRSQLES